MIKSFTKYTLTLVAILMVTSNAWAAATCHTITKLTFTTDASYESGIFNRIHYYYSQPQQQFLQINDNGYSTLSSVTFTVTGDKNDGVQTFKILYNTGSGWQYYDNNNYSLSRGGLLQGHPAGSTKITLSDIKIKSATAFGIEFTNYNTNSSGNTNKRTITISEVNVTFSPYFQSDANNTTLEAFPPTEKGTPCSTTRSFTYKYNNTVTTVNWKSSNPMFTVSSTHTDDCSGETEVTITFKPTEIRNEITSTITGTDNNGNKITVYVKGSSWGKEDPTYTWKPEIWDGTSQVRTIYVGETINDILSYTSSPANSTYTIEKLQDYGINNGDATTTFTDNTLVAGRAGKYKLTVSQPAHDISATSGYNAGETTIILTISKRETSFDWALADTYWVDDQIKEESIITNKTNNEVAISVSESEGYFTYSNNTLKANGKTMPSGESHTTTITVTQEENYKWTKCTKDKEVTVKRHKPVFIWKDPVYFNQTTISDYFTTNNTDTEIKIESQSDTDVAVLYFNPNDANDKHTLDLTTYYKETTPASSTTVTVSQAEDRYWQAYSESHTVIPQNRNNHLSNTPITEANLNDFKVEYVDPWKTPWSDGIHFGQGGIGSGDGGWNWDDKYIIIEFTGVPDSLFFTTATTSTAGMDNPLTNDDNATNNKFFYVSAGTSKDDLKEIWSSTSQTNNYKDKLDPSVRFLKLCYTGNLEGWFKNVRITELNEFEAKVEGQDETTIDTLDFGDVHITDKTEKTMVFNFKYANAGYKVSLDLDQTGGWAEEEAYQEAKKYIKITPPLIDTIGGEKYGEVKNIQVTFHSDDQSTYTIPEDARLKIADEAGHITYVYLKGEIVCTEDQIDWNAYFSLQEPIQIPLSTDSIYNAANTDKYSKLPLKYRSASNGSIIKVSPNGKCFIPAGIGKDTIYAYHDGNNKVCPVESMKIVVVTEKSIQLIDWRDDLSDLIFGSDDNITLTAKVYIIDVVNNTFEYSPEQTANLVYTVADEGESVVSIEEGTTTLKVNSLGETNLTVTIAPNDSLEGATMTIPVVVREPAIGCEDKLLLDQTAPVEIFTEGMNTNQIVKPAIPIDRSKGVPGYLKFEHKGEYWKLTGLINYYAGNIKAQQSTDGGTTWTDVPGSEIKPTVGTYNPTSLLPIDTNATHIRFVRPDGGQGYHYYRNVQVYPAQYIETSTNSLNFEKINMGGTYSKTITISYSNIKSPIINSTSSKDITITPASFGECSGFGTQEVTIKWNPNTKDNQYIIFKDTLIDLSVRVDLIAEIDGRKQAIVWNNRTGAIHDYTDIDNRPTHTIDYNNQQPLDHPITYEVKAGNAAFENGIFFIKGTGDITIHAYHDGNDAYQRVDSFYQFNIPSMPPTFLGTAGDSLWTTEANWANNYVPSEAQAAVILAPLVIRDHKIIINQLLVSDEGSVHITSAGGLTVGTGGIQCSKTDGSAIVIDNLYSGAGFLRVDPTYGGTMPRITMRYQTRSTLDNGANKDAEWQYIGAPGLNSTIYVDYNTWLYKLDEPNNNWVLQPRVDSVSLDPFEGYAITQYGKPIYEWTADMTTEDCTIPLTYSKNGRGGRHIIANSYTAPINVAAFTGDEFQFLEGMSTKYRIEQTLYIFNSGSWNNWHEQDSLGTGTYTDGTNTPGQYYAIPVLAARENYLEGLQTTIAPMQGIYLRVRSLTPLEQLPDTGEQVGNLVLNYEQLVMGSGHEMHRPMRAPQRTTSSAMQDPNFRRVRIVATSENSGADRVYIIQDNINTRKYNNGYDATNQEAKGLVNIYTNETGGKMEVSCSNNIDSMYIGFMAGSDHTYTLHFSAIIGDILYLQDLDNGQKISIVEGGSYTFEAEPQSTNHKRFLLLTSQGVSTGTDEVALANIWYTNKALHITNAPNNSTLTLYDISGHQLLSTTIQETPYTLDLSHLTEGIYIARLNNQVYKFVCK